MLTNNWLKIFIKNGLTEKDRKIFDNLCMEAIDQDKVLFLGEKYVDKGRHNLVLDVLYNYNRTPETSSDIVAYNIKELKKLLSFVHDVSEIEYFKDSISVKLDMTNERTLDSLLRYNGYEPVTGSKLMKMIMVEYKLVRPNKDCLLPTRFNVKRNFFTGSLTIDLKNS